MWTVFFDLLYDLNQAWCKDAEVLVVLSLSKCFCRKWMAFALEETARSYVVHGIGGFD